MMKIQGYWKVPGREVYCERFADAVAAFFRCHVWLRINPPKLTQIG